MPDQAYTALRRTADALVAAVLAPACAACRRPLEHPLDGPVCPACWQTVAPLAPPLCRICGATLPSWRTISQALERCAACRRRGGAIAAGASAGAYDGALREIIHAFKYDRRRSLARPLAAMMRRAGADVLLDAACVVPVPLHPWRRLQRGFNQAADLASGLGLPVVSAVWRHRATRQQSGLTAGARRRNVRSAFGRSPFLSRRSGALVSGRIVVLVDDVRTTGATLDACAQVLLGCGAREVRALTLAHAPVRDGTGAQRP
jgi:ComF family protein